MVCNNVQGRNWLSQACAIYDIPYYAGWPRGLMDKASDFGSEDCEFESRRGHKWVVFRLNESTWVGSCQKDSCEHLKCREGQ